MHHLRPMSPRFGPDRRPSIEQSGGQVIWLDAPGGVRVRAAWWPGGQRTVLFLNGRIEFIERNLEAVCKLTGRGFFGFDSGLARARRLEPAAARPGAQPRPL